MMKTNIMKKAIATLAILGTISTLNLSTVVFAADEIPVNPQPAGTSVIDYNELGLPLVDEMPLDGMHWRWEDVEWYDTYEEAVAHYDFNVGDHAELKYLWLPIKGWCTHGCTIKDRFIQWEGDKCAPVYKNDYDGHYYFRLEYE